MVYQVPHFIAGQARTDQTTMVKPITNPATGETIGWVPIADLSTCNQAVSSANQAWQEWSQSTASKRSQILFQFV